MYTCEVEYLNQIPSECCFVQVVEKKKEMVEEET